MTRRRAIASATRGRLFAAELLAWCGTPFHDQAATKGAGADCKGLMWGAARDLGFPEATSLYARFIAYDLRVAGGVPVSHLGQGLADLFDPVDMGADPDHLPLQLGDLLLLKHNGLAQHLAGVATASTAVHAQIAPNPIVKEASLDALLRKCPLVSAWRWRDLKGTTNVG